MAVAALGERFALSEDAVARLERLLERLVTDPLAPTAIHDPRRAIDDHLADALVALELPAVAAARTLADLGSGTGIPGLPLAIAKPDARVYLVESSARKCEFLEQTVRACGLGNVAVACSRAESWSSGRGSCQLVTARALDSPAVVAEYAAPLLRIGGALVLWRGARDRVAEAEGARAMATLGLERREIVQVRPYEAAQRRYLHVILKVRPTPAEFPRRPGIARKRPLGKRIKQNSSAPATSSDRARR